MVRSVIIFADAKMIKQIIIYKAELLLRSFTGELPMTILNSKIPHYKIGQAINIKINGYEKTAVIKAITIDGEPFEFDGKNPCCFEFSRSTVNKFKLAWVNWSCEKGFWGACCKGPGLNNNCRSLVIDGQALTIVKS